MPGAHPGWGRPIVCPETHATRNHPLTRDLRTRKAKHSGMYMRARAYTHKYIHTHTHIRECTFTDRNRAERTESRAFEFRRWNFQRKFCRSGRSLDYMVSRICRLIEGDDMKMYPANREQQLARGLWISEISSLPLIIIIDEVDFKRR